MSVLAPGLLVASPPPGDPNFDRSVVLLAAGNFYESSRVLLSRQWSDLAAKVQGGIVVGDRL